MRYGMNTIQIDVGVYTPIEIDLSKFDFTGVKKVVLTVKNSIDDDAPVIFKREYTNPVVYDELITPEESLKLTENAKYDFIEVLSNGQCFKVTYNGDISLRRGVGRVGQY